MKYLHRPCRNTESDLRKRSWNLHYKDRQELTCSQISVGTAARSFAATENLGPEEYAPEQLWLERSDSSS